MKLIKTALIAISIVGLSVSAQAEPETYTPKHYWLKVGAIFASTKEALDQAREFFYVEGDNMAYAKLVVEGTEGGPIVSMPLKTPKRIFLGNTGFLGLGLGDVSFHFKGDSDTYWVNGEDITHN